MSSSLNPVRSPNPVTLKSLQHYASRQTKLIESLFDPSFPDYDFRDSNDKYWIQFYEVAWGKDPNSYDKTEEIERGPDAIDDSLVLPDILPGNRDVMLKPEVTDNCWYFQPGCNKILIRSEYKEAEEFALSTCGATTAPSALVVTGQPGIGSSPFYSIITGP